MAAPSARRAAATVATAASRRTLRRLGHRSKATLRDRVHRVRANLGLAVQAGVAAGLAWAIAHYVIGHPAPFFAPIAAVITLAVSVGQRWRRTFELVLGVALGIAVADLLILLIGTGAWQVGLVVTLAIIAAIFVGGGPSLVTQAAASAVLVATLTPTTTYGLYTGRFVDALVGGGVGLVVMTVLLPLNPLSVVSRAAHPLLDVLADGLRDGAQALADRDRPAADRVLDRLRDAEEKLTALEDAVQAAGENSTLAPVRWRVKSALLQYVEAAPQIGRALRDTRVLVRRVETLVLDDEPVPDTLPEAVRALARAARSLRRELAEQDEPQEAREAALDAVTLAGRAYAQGLAFSGNVVVAQVRSVASDLVRATGVEPRDAHRLIRQAFREGERSVVRPEPEDVDTG